MFNILPSAGLAYHFATLLEGFCLSLRVHYAAEATDLAKVALVWNEMRRRCCRIADLFARFRAGTLRPARARPARGRPAEPPARAQRGVNDSADDMAVSGPRRRVGALRRFRPLGALYAYRLACLLEQPEAAVFLTDCPRAGGMLRSIWHMLCADPLPAVLRSRAQPALPGPDPIASAGPAWCVGACDASGPSADPLPQSGPLAPVPLSPDPPNSGQWSVAWRGRGEPFGVIARRLPLPICMA